MNDAETRTDLKSKTGREAVAVLYVFCLFVCFCLVALLTYKGNQGGKDINSLILKLQFNLSAC